MSDWRIKLEPVGPGDGGLLDIVTGDKDQAAQTLSDWAWAITKLGHVPDGLEWRNRSPAVITGRVSMLRYRVRVDSFEVETDSGTTSGAGFLYAEEQPDE